MSGALTFPTSTHDRHTSDDVEKNPRAAAVVDESEKEKSHVSFSHASLFQGGNPRKLVPRCSAILRDRKR